MVAQLQLNVYICISVKVQTLVNLCMDWKTTIQNTNVQNASVSNSVHFMVFIATNHGLIWMEMAIFFARIVFNGKMNESNLMHGPLKPLKGRSIWQDLVWFMWLFTYLEHVTVDGQLGDMLWFFHKKNFPITFCPSFQMQRCLNMNNLKGVIIVCNVINY